jgi:hypothetical protein
MIYGNPQHINFFHGDEGTKRKATPVQAWIVPEGSRRLRILDLMTTGA